MIRPTREEFLQLAGEANLIPVSTQIMADLETPVSAFLKLSRGSAYLLESVEGGHRVGRYSFLGFDPDQLVSIRGTTVTIKRPGGGEETHRDPEPLRRLFALIGARRLPATTDLPAFAGGAVGYLSYDAVRWFERVPDANPDPLELPDAIFMFARRYLIFDRVTHRLHVVCNALVDGNPEEAYRSAVAAVEETVAMLGRPVPPEALAPPPSTPAPEITPSMDEAAYGAAVERCLEHIRRGDILQAVLSVRFGFPLATDPFLVYRSLRLLNPSPYMFYLRLDDLHLVGSSPEMMVRVEGNQVTMNPIAGTRPRGATPAEDAAMEKDLLDDAKEAAEHLMLVDLGRNDLGRICNAGTVTVPSFRRVERFSHVMHLVSTVQGEIPLPADSYRILQAVFPAGTVSGAPKIRAMEIIDDLETVRRGPYAGLVGYFDFRGNMDSCITIRTIVAKGGRAFIQAGAGIVADSKPDREYQECRHKAEALFRAVRMAQGGEL
jgi:anthranilate synthase component 1